MIQCTNWDEDWGPCGRCTHCLAEQGSQKLDSVESRLERLEAGIEEIRLALLASPPQSDK